MALRCVLFSSDKESVQPIFGVLAELGLEAEYCESAVDAVEKVTTHLFQIVITDWDDQPEAGFLLKTCRDQKASHRPLTLAIVKEADRPKALQAGANSVLVKPLRPEQARDTLNTACQLLKAKQQPASSGAVTSTGGTATAAAPAMISGPAALPLSVTQAPETGFRAGEFLQSPNHTPGTQFDTETEAEVKKSLEEAGLAEADALTDLEPTAAAVQEGAEEASPVEVPPAPEPLTGWAALQARLNKSAPAEKPAAEGELLGYGETPSLGGGATASAPAEPAAIPQQTGPVVEAQPKSHETDLSYESDASATAEPRRKHGSTVLIAVLATVAVVIAIPKTRQSLGVLGHAAVRGSKGWLNPAPPALQQTATQHDSFGQAGDEYNLPTPTNIPDATTDPSQIRVVPVIDPTAKPDKKNDDANAAQGQPGVVENPPAGAAENPPAGPTQAASTPNAGIDGAGNSAANSAAASAPAATIPTAVATPTSAPAVVTPAPPVVQPPTPRPTVPVAQATSPASANKNTGIPSSLKTQLASSAPDAGGTMPPEAAMSSIEPVKLAEGDLRALLIQGADPAYPATAKASGQSGSVVIQVTVGRDGSVQDAKFLQGSLMFARAALDAVKQWHFKPYSMNGRPVSVQSVITLGFKPPA